MFDLEIPEGTIVTEPVGYLDFLELEGGAKQIYYGKDFINVKTKSKSTN
jgi:hypothetical protein